MTASPNSPVFRNGMGTRYLKALFFEETDSDKSTVVYTLKDKDHMGYPSLYRLYMEEEDLTEYRFANKFLDGWEHWLMLCQCQWFTPLVERWRQELVLKIKAQALERIKALSRSSAKESFQAAKFLLEHGWDKVKSQPASTKGRPSKEEIKKAALEIARHDNRLDEDFKRISLNA